MLNDKFRQRLVMAAVVAVILSVASAGTFADSLPITDSGILQIESLQGTTVGITTSPLLCINWSGGSSCPSPLATVQMGVSGTSNLFEISASTTDQIKNVGVGAPPTLAQFETVEGAGALAGETIDFDLTSLITNGGSTAGNCTSNANFNACTPAFSPFTLLETPTGVSISFSVLLNAYTGTSASGVTPYQGLFTTQVSGTIAGSGPCAGMVADITNILICGADGGTINSTWSATESPMMSTTTPAPEPESGMLLLAGLLGLAFCTFRSRQAHFLR